MSHHTSISCLLLLLMTTSLTVTPAFAQQNEEIVTPVQFTGQQIASESFESVAVFDVNNDGEPDILSGSYWYEGPDFLDRSYIGDVERAGEYWDDFLTIPMDVNGDGNVDYITGGWFSQSIFWVENPGDNSEWTRHLIDETGNVETARAWDVDGDGFEEIVPNNPNDPLKFYMLDRDENGRGAGTFTRVDVSDVQDHGLGFGDINGDGRGDFIVSDGWIEAPDNVLEGEWIVHEEFDFGSASIPILVVDVNGDSRNDIIVGQAHSYGLDWYEQTTDDSGERLDSPSDRSQQFPVSHHGMGGY